MDDESDTKTKHFSEELRFSSNEHGKEDKEFLSQHGSGLVSPVSFVDDLPQFLRRDRSGDGVFTHRRHADGDLFLSHKYVCDGFGEIFNPFPKDPSDVSNQSPLPFLACFLVQILEEILDSDANTIQILASYHNGSPWNKRGNARCLLALPMSLSL